MTDFPNAINRLDSADNFLYVGGVFRCLLGFFVGGLEV